MTDSRTEMIKFRVTPDEKDRYGRAAGGKISAWLREAADEKLARGTAIETTAKTFSLLLNEKTADLDGVIPVEAPATPLRNRTPRAPKASAVKTVECPKSKTGDHEYKAEKGSAGMTVKVCTHCGDRKL